MKSRTIRKRLAAVLAVCMVAGAAMTVNATTTASSSASETVTEAVATSSDVTINGAKVVSTVGGAYMAKKVNGTVVKTPLNTLKAAYGLASNQTPYIVVMDTDQKKSHKAMASLNGAAEALGAVVGPVININFGVKTDGKFAALPTDGAEVEFTVGLPNNFVDAGATYAVIGVRAGGATEVYPDVDSDPKTVTFNMKGGLGCYAVVKY